jgi:hypothetical protein
MAAQMPNGVGMVDGSGNEIVWQEITTRVWARQYVQSSGD